MTFINPHFLARDRQRWLRPDWQRYARPDAARWLRPDAEQRIGPQTWELKYRPDQPRVPAGNPDGGQWTRDYRSGGATLGGLYGGLDKYDFGDLTEINNLFGLSAPEQPADDSGGALPTAINSGEGINDPRVMSDAVPDNEWIPGAQYAANDKKYSVNLYEEEGFGHTIKEHVGKSDHELLAKTTVDRGPLGLFHEFVRKRMGSFDSVESANDFVNRTLEANKDIVDNVASGKMSSSFMKYRFGYVTGREAVRLTDDAAPVIRITYGAGITIVHDPRVVRGYRIRTAYPRNDYPKQ